MDKFLIKTPRPLCETYQSAAKPKYKQTTIESCKGVVVVEEVLRLKAILKLADQTDENILKALTKLHEKIPSREVLKSTKIGHTINRLSKHKNPEVSKKAAAMVLEWKKYFQDKSDKPMIEIRFDKQTETMRSNARKQLSAAAHLQEGDTLVELVEREVFHQHSRLINNDYRRCMRSIVFSLKHEDVRYKLTHRKIQVSDLVKQHTKDGKRPSLSYTGPSTSDTQVLSHTKHRRQHSKS